MSETTGTLSTFGALALLISPDIAQATVTGVGTDTTTGANWRTAAALETDNEYGTDGYVIYGIDAADSVFSNPYAFDMDQTVLPTGIIGVATDSAQMWSGNGNFGTMEDPGNGNAITNTSLSVLIGGGATYTISRAAGTSFRLTLLAASGDGSNAKYDNTVDDGSGGVLQTTTHAANGLHYHVFDISSGSTDVVVSTSVVNTAGPAAGHFGLTGLAFDNVVAVADTAPPMIVPPTSPADEASGVLVSADLVATFDENIALTGVGTVTIRDLGAGPDVVINLPAAQVSVSGTDLTISPSSDLVASNNYAVQVSADAVEDLAAVPNAFAGILDDTTWNFQTAADGTAPTILPPTSPADEASGVALDTNLVATFSETIAAGSGNITIKNITEGTETVIPVGDAQVSVSGADLTINPATDLDLNDDYAIRIDAGAVTDTTGNPFAGIGDDTTWNFATEAAVPLVVGTKIGLAPGPTATDDAGNDWFDFSATNTTYNVIHDLDGDIVDGVSVQVVGGVGFNTAGEDNWVGLSTEGGSAPAEFVDSVTTDLMFNDATITITGLDPALSYDITTVSHGGGSGFDAVEDTHTITGAVVHGPSTHTRGDARLNGTFHSFPGVSPDGSGTIVLVTNQPSGTNAAFNGLLLEAKDPSAADYAGWAGLFAGFTVTDPGTDFEGDGLASALEWVLDGDPTAPDAASVTPSFDNTTDPDDFLFTFRRRDDAAADPNTTIVVEYGSNLTGWTTAQNGVDGVTITVDDDGFGTSVIDGVGVDEVTVAIPRALAVGGKLFVRLNVTVVP